MLVLLLCYFFGPLLVVIYSNALKVGFFQSYNLSIYFCFESRSKQIMSTFALLYNELLPGNLPGFFLSDC